MKEETKQWLYPLIIVIGIVYAGQSGVFGINLQTSDIVFYNKPIVLPFTVTNFTSPTVEVYWNNILLHDDLNYQTNESHINITTNQSYSTLVNQTYNQSIVLSLAHNSSGVYQVTLENIQAAGLIKIKLTEGNYTETKSVEVRKAYVRIEHNIENLVDLNHQSKIIITTKNPQGDDLEADSVDIDIIDPLNNKNTIFLEKSGNNFTKTFDYTHDGNYQFKIHAKKEGYVTQEVTAITAVTKEAGVHPIVYVFAFGAGLWILLFSIKLIRRITK